MPNHAAGSDSVNGTATPTCVGDPEFHGMFLVRYSDRAQWDARIAWAASERVHHSYVRALVFQIFLLTTMAHEPIDLLGSTISALTPRLVAERKIGGFAGSGDLVTMILQRAAPVSAVLNACPNATAAAAQFGQQIAALAGPLALALGWDDEIRPQQPLGATDEPAATKLSPLLSWPHEDAQTESRDRKHLTPVVLMSAVAAGHSATIAAGLVLFRRSVVANGTAVDAQVARAAYFNAVRWGTAEDTAALERLLNATAKSQPDRVGDVLFGLSAGAASPTGCAIGLSALKLHATTSDIVPALADMLRFAPACEAAIWDTFVSSAQMLWASEGAAGTAPILAAFSAFGASALPAATALLATQNATTVSPEDAYAALTQIRINGDLCLRV